MKFVLGLLYFSAETIHGGKTLPCVGFIHVLKTSKMSGKIQLLQHFIFFSQPAQIP